MSDIKALKRIHRMGPFLAYFFEYDRGAIRDTPAFQMLRPGVVTPAPNDAAFQSNHEEPLLTRNSMHFMTHGRYRLITPAGQAIDYSMNDYPTGRQVREGFYTQHFLEDTGFVCILPIVVATVYYQRRCRCLRAREELASTAAYLFAAHGALTALTPVANIEVKRGVVLYTGGSKFGVLRDTLVLETTPEDGPDAGANAHAR